MKKFIVGVLFLALAPLGALAAVPTATETQFVLDNDSNAGPAMRLGTQITQERIQVKKCVYDYAVLGGGTTATPLTLKDTDGGPCALPAAALILGGYLDVVTDPTATVYTNSTLSWSTGSGASDLLAGKRYTAFTSTLGNTQITLIPVGTTATMIKTRGIVNPKLTVNGILTAGKINLFIQYLLSN